MTGFRRVLFRSFSSYSGVTAFFPSDVSEDSYAPPVLVTDVQIAGKSLAIGKLRQAAPFTDAIELKHNQNVVTLDFAALSFASPEQNRYRYRLESFQPDWVESVGNRRSVTYALSPGDYTFHVQGSTSHGVWNERSLRIVVLPPWWATWQFRVVMALLLAAAQIGRAHV